MATFPPERPLETHPKAIVVGASSGIGAALVGELVARGYRVIALARREHQLAEITAEANAKASSGSGASFIVHDATDFDSVPALFEQACQELGGLDLIIYVAAVQHAVAVDEYEFQKDHEMVRVNFLGAVAWLNEAASRFDSLGRGHIAAVSSISGERGRRSGPGYNSSKAALNTYLEALRNRLSVKGVQVTTVKPGFVNTRLLENASRAMWVIEPDDAASKILEAIRKRRQTAFIPGRWSLVSLVIRHIPSVIFRRFDI